MTLSLLLALRIFVICLILRFLSHHERSEAYHLGSQSVIVQKWHSISWLSCQHWFFISFSAHVFCAYARVCKRMYLLFWWCVMSSVYALVRGPLISKLHGMFGSAGQKLCIWAWVYKMDAPSIKGPGHPHSLAISLYLNVGSLISWSFFILRWHSIS